MYNERAEETISQSVEGGALYDSDGAVGMVGSRDNSISVADYSTMYNEQAKEAAYQSIGSGLSNTLTEEGGARYDSDGTVEGIGASNSIGPTIRGGARQQTQQRLIIKTGNMSIDVDDIDIAINDAIGLTTGLDGYIISQEVSGHDYYRSASLSLGVPVSEFENVMAALREYGDVGAESATGEDITEEYVDLNSRMTNLIAIQGRLRALLEDARNVEDTLKVDRELRDIEEEMNIIQGRIKFLADRAAFSTIMVHFSFQAEASIPEPHTFNLGRTAQLAFVELQETIYEVTDAAVYFGIVCGPWLLVLLALVWVVIRVIRRNRRRREVNSAEITPPPAATDDSSNN
ncbi:MAG: DUF4349 domain-containing protein [Candidatus Promineifilaceae bacterium]